MSRRFTSAPKCEKCQKSVYFNEEVKDGERVYHKQCFRCTHCNKIVEPTSYSQYGGVIYCKPHFLALFRARGKYEDLSNGQPDAQAQKPKPAVAPASFSNAAFSAQSPTNAPVRGKKDMTSALRRRNPAEVEAFVEQRGLNVLFTVGADGVTPIETAFANNNLECGRVMLKYIKQALETKDFAWEKEFTEEVVDTGDVRKAFEEPKEWKKSENNEIADSLSKLKKVDRAALENKAEEQQPNEIELRKSALKAAKAEENQDESVQPQQENQAELEPKAEVQQQSWEQPQQSWEPQQPQEQQPEPWQQEKPEEQQPQEQPQEQQEKYSYDYGYAQNEQPVQQEEAQAPVSTAASDYTEENQPYQSEYNYEASAY